MDDESKIKIIQDPPKTSAIEEIPQDLKATTLSGLKELQNLLPHGDLGRIVNSFIFINHPDAVFYQRRYCNHPDKVFLVQYLCEHLLSRGNQIDLNTEYPRLNRHVRMVVKKIFIRIFKCQRSRSIRIICTYEKCCYSLGK